MLISAVAGRVRPSRPLALTCMFLALSAGLLAAQGTLLEVAGVSSLTASFVPAVTLSSLGGMLGLLASLGLAVAGFRCWPRIRQVPVPLQERSLAAYDHVTGLPTLRLFQVLLEQAVARASHLGRSVGVLVVELSQFRPDPVSGAPLSETLVSRVQAARIKSALRSRDTVAYLGGRRFAVLIEGVLSVGQVTACAHHIQHTLSLPLLVAGQEVFLSCKIGGSMLNQGSVSGQSLLAESINALALATTEQSIRFCESSMNERSGKRFAGGDRTGSLDALHR